MWETWVRSLVREDPLEKEMAIHCNTIAWKIAESQTQRSDFTFTGNQMTVFLLLLLLVLLPHPALPHSLCMACPWSGQAFPPGQSII